MKFASANLIDNGPERLRTLATTAARVKLHVVKAYSVGDSYATVVGNSVAVVDLSQADLVITASGLNRVLTSAAKNGIALTGSTQMYDSGTATAGGASTMTDSGKSWTTNQHANRALKIVAGTGSGQVNRVASNTSTVITVATAWATQPDATSQYQILDDVHFAFVDSTGSTVEWVTDESTNIVLTSGGGNAVNIPALTYTFNQPT